MAPTLPLKPPPDPEGPLAPLPGDSSHGSEAAPAQPHPHIASGSSAPARTQPAESSSPATEADVEFGQEQLVHPLEVGFSAYELEHPEDDDPLQLGFGIDD